MNLWFLMLFSELTTGGINVMTYDLSGANIDFSECPGSSTCSLSEQVDFYLHGHVQEREHPNYSMSLYII